MIGWHCAACGHTHTGPQLANICIGCPCPETSATSTDHDDRLEPLDDTIADLQSEIVRQRERDENLLAVEKYAHECSAEDLLADAAVLLRAYEAKKGEAGDQRPNHENQAPSASLAVR